MRQQVLVGGLVALSIVVIAGPALAKASIAEAEITGPGLGGRMTIEAPETEGLWESGIDVAGGLDDARAGSVEELGLTSEDLGPRYLVTYRFHGTDDLIRQDLYPYAKGGPVAHISPGQQLTALFGDAGDMPITAGWYQSSLGFFQYLADHGLPETNPVAPVASGVTVPDTAPGAQTTPWVAIVVALAGLAALSLAAPAVRRRVLPAARMNR